MPVLCLLLIAAWLRFGVAFYLPGIAVRDYHVGDPVLVLANKLTSPSNSVPFPYYSLPFCRPSEKLTSMPVNLGQILAGERAFPTSFNISMKTNAPCQLQCLVHMPSVEKNEWKRLVDRIEQNYFARLNIDNMPVITRYITKQNSVNLMYFGHPIGFKSDNYTLFMYNHLEFKISYHRPSLTAGEPLGAWTTDHQTYRIVGVEVNPHSINHQVSENLDQQTFQCQNLSDASPQPLDTTSIVAFTYSVTFEPSDLAWATRWDPLLSANDHIKRVQWFSIANSLMVSILLSGVVAMVMLRTVLKDFGRYNNTDEDDSDDLSGWKYVHADVFRPPQNAPFLAICTGSGAQVLVMAALTQLFALFGFLSPANRGSLLTALVTLWVLASAVSGFVSAKIYNSLYTGYPRRNVTFATALVFPGITFGIFFVLNLALWTVGSSGSVPIMTLVLILFMWFGISVPLVFLGARVAYRQSPFEFPTRTNKIQRQIPSPLFGISPKVYSALAGALPFGVVVMQLIFILNSVRSGSVYYLYGAMTAVFGLLIITCAEMSIVSTYLSLVSEDWRSHWHSSFWGPGSSGLYVFLYSLYFSLAGENTSQIPIVSQIVFICWSLVVSGAFSLMCGTIGFFSSLWFTKKIYASIRID